MININEAHDIGKLYGLITDIRSERLNNKTKLNANRLVDLRENIDIVAQGLEIENLICYFDEVPLDINEIRSEATDTKHRNAVESDLLHQYGDVIDAIKTYYAYGDSHSLIERLYNIYELEVSL